ncbi:MAG TPA: SRPBCC family protein [Myxococcota bacterium]|nr:SRPBCC family protein [Myxococcota bacterium]
MLLFVAHALAADPAEIHAVLDDPSGWDLHASANDDGVTVYTKYVFDLGLQAFKGVLVLPGNVDPAAVYELIADIENHDRHSAHLHESTLIEREGNHDWFYEVSKSPGPLIAERYWFNETVTELDIGGVEGHNKRAWSGFDAEAKYPETLEAVRGKYPDAVYVEVTYGAWEWIPQDDGTTLMVYQTVSHPGGKVPGGLYAQISGKTLPENMMTFVNAAKP